MSDGAPKPVHREGGKLASRIEPRPQGQRPAGAQALLPRSPKAPLPPRVSLPDGLEVGTADPPRPAFESIEPESMDEQTTALPAPPDLDPYEDGGTLAMPNGLQNAFAQLQRTSVAPQAQQAPRREPTTPPETKRLSEPPPRREEKVPSIRDLGKDLGRPATVPTEMLGSPIMPQSPSSKAPAGSGIGALNLKPGTTPLSPARNPSPMAIVGANSSLRISTGPERPMSVPPRSPATAPGPSWGGAGGSVPPNPQASSSGIPMPNTWSPPTSKGLGSAQPPPQRPAGPGKSLPPPAGGPPVQYERAFRQWSSPPEGPTALPTGPVSFQVYTAHDIGAGRAMQRSLPPVGPPATKANVALLVGASLIGIVVVLLTAAAVVAVSTEEPKRAAPTMTVAPPPPPPPEPAPTAISIGDPLDDPPPAASGSAATPAPPPKLKARSLAPKPPGGTLPTAPDAPVRSAAQTAQAPQSPQTAAPPNLRGMAPPPNPYGK